MPAIFIPFALWYTVIILICEEHAMKRHLFLTGSKHIGKSTVIDKMLAMRPCTTGGFRTVRTDTVFPPRFSVHMLRPGERPTADNLLFICRAPSEDTVARFDALGCAALAQSDHARLLLMDELGPTEAEAFAFQRAVLSALEGDIPVLGVLQQADSPFLQRIAARDDVTVAEVTRENRDRLPQLLLEQFHF